MVSSKSVNGGSRAKHARKREVLAPELIGADSILHVGCVGRNVDGERDPERWLHAWLDDQAERVVGIDINEAGIDALDAGGYEVYHRDAQEFALDSEFDCIVAANVIEHLPNPGQMLACARDHLTTDGKIIVTTPRPWGLHRFLTVLARGEVVVEPSHTMWFDLPTLERLATMQELTLVDAETYSWDRPAGSTLDRLYLLFEQLLRSVGPDRILDYQFKAIFHDEETAPAQS